jgi:radical SAM superfamily enzyme YgiQ (UPF0313 family)
MKVGLVQINNSFSGQSYFPYSLGLLQAYAEENLSNPEDFEFMLPIFSRVMVDDAVEQLLEADVILFSLYVWNVRLSMEIARRVKKQNPNVVIICGGPQVPDKGDSFLRDNPHVDLACHGPGEKMICEVLEKAAEKNWEGIPGVSYLSEEDAFLQSAKALRAKSDLQNWVSPYLSGVFEPLIKANPDTAWLVMWETNRGCPFSCTFCDWGSATASKVYQIELNQLLREVDWFAEKGIEFIFCCDANYGILKRDLEITKYVVETKKRTGFPHALSVQNTKNAKGRAYEVQKLLADNGLNKGVTLSMQSVDPTTLENIKRSNISIDNYRTLQHKFTADRIETYNDLILALPGETYDSFVAGISEVIENGQHNRIQFNNLSILPNAEMGNPEYQEKHGLVTIESDIINIHGSLSAVEEVVEKQDLVIASATMPKEDWVKTRAVCWLTAFLYFDKMLQMPMLLLHKLGHFTPRQLIESFTGERVASSPVFTKINEFYLETAREIQEGAPEYCRSEEWLNIYWPADELTMIELSTENKFDTFYTEAEQLLNSLLEEHNITLPDGLLSETIELNKELMKQPFQKTDKLIHMQYNVLDFYENAIVGIDVPIAKQPASYFIDKSSQTWDTWDEWCQKVVWYGNKKGAYLYPIRRHERAVEGSKPFVEAGIAGHY